jgi:hypothetical protein
LSAMPLCCCWCQGAAAAAAAAAAVSAAAAIDLGDDLDAGTRAAIAEAGENAGVHLYVCIEFVTDCKRSSMHQLA